VAHRVRERRLEHLAVEGDARACSVDRRLEGLVEVVVGDLYGAGRVDPEERLEAAVPVARGDRCVGGESDAPARRVDREVGGAGRLVPTRRSKPRPARQRKTCPRWPGSVPRGSSPVMNATRSPEALRARPFEETAAIGSWEQPGCGSGGRVVATRGAAAKIASRRVDRTRPIMGDPDSR
jgi:hypothetical protein